MLEVGVAQLIERLGSLPSGSVLLRRLGDLSGVYLVGGAVRDLLLGGQPDDLDLAVEGELAQVIARLGRPARANDRFGTCTVLAEGFSYDVARTRCERYERPGALPTVIGPATIEVDLRRRDFTVNSIALGLGGQQGGVVAVAGALEDLERRRLRVLHDHSFRDDPTRLLRLARYAARLRFGVEAATRRLAIDAVETGALRTVSGSRLGAELRLLLAEPDPVAALRELRELRIDAAIAPGFGIAEPDLVARALALLPQDGQAGDVAMAVALAGVSPDERRPLLDELSFPSPRRGAIIMAAQRAPALAHALAAADRPSRIADAVGDAPVELVALAGAIGGATQAARWLGDLRHVRLEISGDDLLRAGISAGPAVGEGLGAARAARLDGVAVDREAQLQVALTAVADRARQH